MQRENSIDLLHRKELLKFLLVKTAVVRCGVKPAELLRIRHCYEGVNSEGLRVCLYRRDIYETLGLDYVELKVEAGGSLVLFYNPPVLAATLAEPRNRRWLERLGYPENGTTGQMLDELCRRAQETPVPHEVGIFIGYPLKDVAGFMRRLPSTPLHGGAWRIYGDVGESLARMKIYRDAEAFASAALESARGIADFFAMISPNGAHQTT